MLNIKLKSTFESPFAPKGVIYGCISSNWSKYYVENCINRRCFIIQSCWSASSREGDGFIDNLVKKFEANPADPKRQFNF